MAETEESTRLERACRSALCAGSELAAAAGYLERVAWLAQDSAQLTVDARALQAATATAREFLQVAERALSEVSAASLVLVTDQERARAAAPD